MCGRNSAHYSMLSAPPCSHTSYCARPLRDRREAPRARGARSARRVGVVARARCRADVAPPCARPRAGRAELRHEACASTRARGTREACRARVPAGLALRVKPAAPGSHWARWFGPSAVLCEIAFGTAPPRANGGCARPRRTRANSAPPRMRASLRRKSPAGGLALRGSLRRQNPNGLGGRGLAPARLGTEPFRTRARAIGM